MDTKRDISLPFNYNESLFKTLIIIIVLLILVYIYNRFFKTKVVRMIHKPNIPKLKSRYMERLEILYNKVNDNKIDVRGGYTELSNIVREFVEKVTGLNASSFSKNDAKKLGMDDLGLLMEEYYPPEFAKVGTGDILNSINKSINLIKKFQIKAKDKALNQKKD